MLQVASCFVVAITVAVRRPTAIRHCLANSLVIEATGSWGLTV